MILTEAAARLLPPVTVAAYAGGPVHTGLWDSVPGAHVTPARSADLFLVLPATADVIGKAAGGIADDLLSTALLAHERPVVFAPAMNGAMFRNRAVQRNIATLRDDGHLFVPPRETLAIADNDPSGGMAPLTQTVVAFLRQVMQNRSAPVHADAGAHHPTDDSVRS